MWAEMLTPLKQGGTKLDHLRQVEKQKGSDVIPELEIPEDGQHIWNWFMELHNKRGSTGFGAAPLLYSEVKAWKELTRVVIEPWEVLAIMSMDNSYLDTRAKIQEK